MLVNLYNVKYIWNKLYNLKNVAIICQIKTVRIAPLLPQKGAKRGSVNMSVDIVSHWHHKSCQKRIWNLRKLYTATRYAQFANRMGHGVWYMIYIICQIKTVRIAPLLPQTGDERIGQHECWYCFSLALQKFPEKYLKFEKRFPRHPVVHCLYGKSVRPSLISNTPTSHTSFTYASASLEGQSVCQNTVSQEEWNTGTVQYCPALRSISGAVLTLDRYAVEVIL